MLIKNGNTSEKLFFLPIIPAMKTMLMLLFLLYSITTKAATYYVATTGNDSNPGTINAPWLTWGKAAFTAVAGDTVYFRGGTYRGDRNYLMKPNSGTASNYICFFNYPGETPILDFNSYSPGSWEYVIRPYNGDNYLHFKGLTVKNFQQKPTSGYIAGIEANGCHHLIFENLRFENIGGPCMGAYGSTEVYFINCDAIGSIDSLATTPGGNGSGFAINTRVDLFDESMYDSRVYFTGCRAWGNGDQGFAMSGQGIVEMTNCWSFDNGRMSGEGYGAKIGFGSTTDVNSLRIIKNCIFAINAYNGLTTNNVGGTPFNVQFYNNFVYRNGYKPTPTDYQYTGAGIWIASGSDEDVPNDMWANNISYANEKGAVVDHGGNYYTHEYNAWDYPGGITVTDDDFISLDTLQLWYPRKSDGSLPDITFGKLAPGSDLIDAGTPSIKTRDYNIILPCNGDAPDLGWYESSGTSSSPTQDSPAHISSVIQNATPSSLEMTYNLTLANIVPAASAFAVKVNNVTRSVNTVAISSSKVLLTLASPVIFGDVVTVAYTKPASNFIQTTSGGVAASITAQNVTNNVAAINNQPPVVSISSPTKSTGFVAPAAITIDANASDPDGSVTKVEFYNGTSKLGEITSAPYSYTWKDVPAGTYSITAAATDNKELKTVSAAVTVIVEKSATTVNQFPSVSVKIPNEKKPKKHDNVVIIAEASDPDGTIDKVELKNGDVTIAEMTIAPYVFTLQNVDTGTYLITAIATDNLGAVSTSDAIELRVEDFYNPDLICLYPNPNNGFFKIDILDELPEQKCTLSIIGLTGSTVYKDVMTNEENSKEIGLPDLQSGTYVLMLTNGNSIMTTKKFIKQ